MKKKKAQHEKNPHAVALGSLGAVKGGLSRSPAKIRAAKRNGKLGGRPTKAQVRRRLARMWRALPERERPSYVELIAQLTKVKEEAK